ncbi:MAG: hypothetical protein HYX66_10025 [Ignavibacteria bacterium]|nr:hypothetical protein [Ignavibacteria bacterium]
MIVRYNVMLSVFFLFVLFTIRAYSLQDLGTDSTGYEQRQSMDDALIARIKEKPLSVQAGLNFMVSNPQDSLRSALLGMNANPVGYGFGLLAAYSLDPTPIVTGGEFAMNFFGGDNRFRVIPNQIGTTDTIAFDIVNFQVPITVFLRFQPGIKTWLHPYVEGVGGLNILVSALSIRQRNGQVLNSESNTEGELSWLYGVGGGLMLKFADIITLPNTLERFLIDFRFRYLWGTSVDLPWISINDNVSSFWIKRTVVDNPSWFWFNVGITAQF